MVKPKSVMTRTQRRKLKVNQPPKRLLNPLQRTVLRSRITKKAANLNSNAFISWFFYKNNCDFLSSITNVSHSSLTGLVTQMRHYSVACLIGNIIHFYKHIKHELKFRHTMAWALADFTTYIYKNVMQLVYSFIILCDFEIQYFMYYFINLLN